MEMLIVGSMVGGFFVDLSNTKKSFYTEVNFIRNTYKKRHLLYTLTHSSRVQWWSETAFQACRLYRLYTLKLLCCVYWNMILLFAQVKQKQRHQQKNGGYFFCFEITRRKATGWTSQQRCKSLFFECCSFLKCVGHSLTKIIHYCRTTPWKLTNIHWKLMVFEDDSCPSKMVPPWGRHSFNFPGGLNQLSECKCWYGRLFPCRLMVTVIQKYQYISSTTTSQNPS